MTSDEALEDDEPIGLEAARRELRKHFCVILDGSCSKGEDAWQILVANECDPPEWIRCSPKSILEWLGY